MNIDVQIDGRLADKLRDGSDRADSLMLGGLVELGDAFVSAARQVAGPGRFANSFASTTAASDTVIAGSRSPLAAVLEKGRKPGRRPPISRRISPAAATRIAAQGTKGKYTVRKAATQIRRDGTVERVARRVVEQIAPS